MAKERVEKVSDVLRAVKDRPSELAIVAHCLRLLDDMAAVEGSSAQTDYERARELVLRFGWNAMAYQILNPGMTLWFAHGGDGVVGFVRFAHTRVVGGAPVCDLARLDAIASEFVIDAQKRGERVCFFGAGERLDSALATGWGWARVLLGAQPVWDPGHWSDAIGRRRSLRAQFNRARNKGVTVSEWPPEVAKNHPALRLCLAQWLYTRHLPPLHFLVEPETLSELRDRRIFVAARGSDVMGFTILSPVPGRDGWLVEQIVRGSGAPNGTAELLIDFAMRAVAASSSTYATLGLSPLSEHASAPHIPQALWLRAILKWVKLHGARFYNFGGLDTFKAKFNPDAWEPIYAIAAQSNFSPRDLYAIAGAFSGGAPLRLVARALAKAALQEARSVVNRLVFHR